MSQVHTLPTRTVALLPETAISGCPSRTASPPLAAFGCDMGDALDVDAVIGRLLSLPHHHIGRPLLEQDIKLLTRAARDLFLRQPTLLELEAPLKVFGDVHGQYADMLLLFERSGSPARSNFLFLGDYVDRGKQQLATICLLLAYKIKYPETFFLLRGNHECADISRLYGFYDECKQHYNIKLWKGFCDTFNCMPLAAVIQDRVFCMHGGLSPELRDLDQIRILPRPMELPDNGIVCDLLWSDPSEHVAGWGTNTSRGISVTFGADVVRSFLQAHDMDLVVRAHQVVEDGYLFFADRGLVTVFSAPNYGGSFDNAAAVLDIDDELHCSFAVVGGRIGRA